MKGTERIRRKIGGKEGDLPGFQGKFGIAVFLLASFVMFLFFYNHSRNAFIGISGEKEPSKELFLEHGASVTQEFPGEDIALMGISIRFGAYEDGGGSLRVHLLEDGQMLEEWEVAAKELENNAYHNFPFQTLRRMKQDAAYQLSITAEGECAVSVWLTKGKEGRCSADGKQLGKYELCWQRIYVAAGLKMWVRLIGVFLFLAVGIAVLRKVNEKALMSGILVVLGAVYFWLCPLGMAPDEEHHFFRAYEISCGEWTSRHMGENGEGGNYLPAALKNYQDSNAEIDEEDLAGLRYGNMSLYAPVSYLPQAVGIKIARMFTGNVAKFFYAGRFGNFLASMLLCLWAIYLIPFGERILLLAMAFPMSLQEMASMAPDGFTIALSMAFFAYVFRLRCSEGKVGKKEMAVIGLMGIVLALCKIVYVALLLLVFLLPEKAFGGRKPAAWFRFGFLGAALAVNLFWLKISAGHLIEAQPGVASGEQVKYILTHLISYGMTIMRTIWMEGHLWVRMMVGCSLGKLDIGISPIAYGMFEVMFIFEVCSCRKAGWKAHKRDLAVLGFTFLSGSALILTSLYVHWTAVGNPIIVGTQGRYFTPLLPCLAMGVVCAFHIRERNLGENKIYQAYKGYFYMILLMLHGITILDVIHHYI